MDYQLIETPDDETFATRSADFLAEAITLTIEDKGQCILGLSGGKTPRLIYEKLAQAMNIDWSKVHLFLIDERCVPADDPESNRKLLDTTLLRYGLIDVTEHCTFPDTSLDPEACAKDYDQKLKKLFDEKGDPDLLVLGIGHDGHIASLFPPVPKDAFGEKLCIHTTTDLFAVHDRITLTVPPLHKANQQCFFFTGAEKRKAWDDMMASEEGPERWPAKGVMANGETIVITRN